MKTQIELRQLKRKLLFKDGGKVTYRYTDKGDNFIVSYHDAKGLKLAYIELYQLQGEPIYVMDNITSDIKGLGALLMYDAMNKIYPNWLCVDREVVTLQGKHLWDSFLLVPYVEQGLLPEHLWVHDNLYPDKTEGVNNMYRYTRKPK